MIRTIALLALCACSTLDGQPSLEIKDATFEMVGGQLKDIHIDLLAWGSAQNDALMLFQYGELSSTDPNKSFDIVLEADFAPGTDRLLRKDAPSSAWLVDAGTPPDQLVPACGAPAWLIICIDAREDASGDAHQGCAFYDRSVVTCH